MSKYLITVNGGSYEVTVEEIGGVAPVAVAPKAAPPPSPLRPPRRPLPSPPALKPSPRRCPATFCP